MRHETDDEDEVAEEKGGREMNIGTWMGEGKRIGRLVEFEEGRGRREEK